MNASQYQKQAARTLIDKPGFEIADKDMMTIWNALGLAGEAGEVADHVKKGIFHQHGIEIDKLSKEIGDVLWYAAALCSTLGLDMSTIMEENLEKLKKRYPFGFMPEDSKTRKDLSHDHKL